MAGYYTGIGLKSGIFGREDIGYQPPEMELLMRLDDLADRTSSIDENDTYYEGASVFSKDILRYILPEHMNDSCIIQRAIDLAKEDLFTKYGLEIASVPSLVNEKYVVTKRSAYEFMKD